MTYRTITESEARSILADEEAEMLPYRAVNEEGLCEIQSRLSVNYKLGGDDYYSPEMLHAWVRDAELQLAEGNDASIEIKSCDSLSGRTETYTLSAAGVEWQICDD